MHFGIPDSAGLLPAIAELEAVPNRLHLQPTSRASTLGIDLECPATQEAGEPYHSKSAE